MNFKKQEMPVNEIKNILADNDVQVIRSLGKELIEISVIKKEAYPFTEKYLDKIIEKMKANSGKNLIDMEDLPDNFIVRFNDTGKNILKDLFKFIKSNYGLDRVNRRWGINFYLINEAINECHGLRVGTFKKYIEFLDNQKINVFNLREAKNEITELKPSIKSKSILINGFPIDLRDKKWALIFGIILDSNLKEFTFVAEDRDFANDVIHALTNVGVNPYILNQGNLVKIKGHSIIGHIINIGGMPRNKRQLIANSCLPPWIFSCSKDFNAILLSKFLDTEGYVSQGRGGIRIAQASLIDLTNEEKEFVLANSKTCIIRPSNKQSKVIIFSKLNENLKEKALSNPSLILLSIQLLLRKYRINSKIYPLCVYISSNGLASISWHLVIHGFDEMNKFYDLCGKHISIKYKRNNLKKILGKQKLKTLPMGLRFPFYLVNALEIQNKKGCFTTKDLIGTSNKNGKSVYAAVGCLAQLNLISIIKKNKHIKFWKITEEGMKKLKKTCENKERWEYLLN